MLTAEDLDKKASELQGDALYLHGHAVKAGYAWEIILRPPTIEAWEAYQRHKNDPSAQFALVQSMNVYCSSDAMVVPTNARDALTAVRARFVGVAEAITGSLNFQRFMGLEVVDGKMIGVELDAQRSTPAEFARGILLALDGDRGPKALAATRNVAEILIRGANALGAKWQ